MVAMIGYAQGPQLRTLRGQLPEFSKAERPARPAAQASAAHAPAKALTIETSAAKAPQVTLDDCLNVGVAISTGQKLELGKTSTETYCVEGYVVNAEDYSLAYGNQSFWLARTQSNSNGDVFEAYQCTISETGTKVLNGDYVRVTGRLSYYDNTNLLTPAGNYIDFVEIKKGTVEILTKTDGDHAVQTEFERINVSTALSKGSALAQGQATSVAYHIYGYVTSVESSSSRRFWIADDPLSTAVSYTGGAYFVYNATISPKVGDLVCVQSKVYNYNGTIETESGVVAEVVTPITITCESIQTTKYFSDENPKNWWVAGTNGTLYACLDYASDDATSPVKENITYVDDGFVLDYCGINSDGGYTMSINIVDGWATVYENSNGNLAARATYIGSDGNIYAISMGEETSSPQTYTIDCGTNSLIGLGNDNSGNYWWYFYGWDGTNYYYFETQTTNTYDPAGQVNTFSDYCGKVDDNLNVLTQLKNGYLSTSKKGTTYYTSGVFTDADGNTYNISMTPEFRPTVQWLEANTNYDLANNVVLVTKFTDDAAVDCKGVSFVGTYNTWYLTNASEMTLLDGFDDWYVVSTPYTQGCQGKPIHADYNGDLDWFFQPAADSWNWIAGDKATITNNTSINEADVEYPSAGAYIYKISAWKGGNPCVKEERTYTFNLYPPTCSTADYKPALVLKSEDYKVLHDMTSAIDNNGKEYYTINITSYPDNAYSYRTQKDLENEILRYYDGNGWGSNGNYYLGHDNSYVRTAYYSDPSLYKWSKCEETPAIPTHEYTVKFYAPNVCDEVPAIIGHFSESNWTKAIAMTPAVDLETKRVYYTYTFTDEEGDGSNSHGFKILGAAGDPEWDNQLLVKGKYWTTPDNFALGSETTITLDCSDFSQYRFGYCVNTELPKKKVVIGVFLPEGVPALGAEVLGSFNNWRGNENDKKYELIAVPQVPGLYYVIIDEKEAIVTAEDVFKIRQVGTWDNQIMVYDESYTDPNTGEHWRTGNDILFGQAWFDAKTAVQIYPALAAFAGMVDKAILLTLNDATKYKWTKTPQTINISISDFKWQYYTTDEDWYIYGSNDDYTVNIDVINKNPKSPVGTFSSADNQFMLNYTRVKDIKNNNNTISVIKADATVKVTDDVITVSATLIGEDGNIYKVSMGREWPTAKKQATITATNLGYAWNDNNQYHYFEATDANGVKVSFDLHTAQNDGYVGTFDVNVDERLDAGVTIDNVFHQAVSGSVTITQDGDKIYLTGKILCYNSVEYTLQLQNFTPALGQSTVRVLIPTDNNMDVVENGVYVWWWNSKLEGQCVKAKDVGGNWYEASFNVEEASFGFLVVNANVGADDQLWNAAGTQQTEDIQWVIVNNSCWEVAYNNGGYYNNNNKEVWRLVQQSCEAKNHDYRLDPDFDTDFAGQLFIELNATQLAPMYELGFKISGSQDDYQYMTWHNEGFTSLVAAFNITQDITYDYIFYAVAIDAEGKGYYVSKTYKDQFTIEANPNIPENLQADVDNEKISFSWTPKGTDTEYYILSIYDKNGNLLHRSDPIMNGITTYSCSIYQTGEHEWYLRAYDDIDNTLSDPGSTFTITKIPDLKPTNLNVIVSGKQATFTWEEPAPADKGYIQVFYGQTVIAEGTLTGENGQFAATYTFADDDKRELSWVVYSRITGHDYFYSEGAYGKDFKAEIQKYTLAISAGDGGTVNTNVNGEYEEGSLVNIVATANSGYSWWKWSDQDTDADRWIKMDKDVTLVAMFKKNDSGQGGTTKTYTLKISSAGGGKVNEEANKTYEEGEVVSITATPNTGWEFDKWSDENKQASRLITMDKDYTLIAYFKTNLKFKVSITAGSGGKVVVDPKLTESEYVGGTQFTIEAKANTGYKFEKWSDGNTQAKRTITITADTELKATFTEMDKATLRVEILPNEKAGKVLFDDEEISVLRKEVYAGETVTLKAKAASGYVFLHFESGSEKITDKEYEVKVDKSKTVYAVFKEEDKEGIDSQKSQVESRKILINGEIYILRGGKIYTVQGQLVR